MNNFGPMGSGLERFSTGTGYELGTRQQRIPHGTIVLLRDSASILFSLIEPGADP